MIQYCFALFCCEDNAAVSFVSQALDQMLQTVNLNFEKLLCLQFFINIAIHYVCTSVFPFVFAVFSNPSFHVFSEFFVVTVSTVGFWINFLTQLLLNMLLLLLLLISIISPWILLYF